MNMCNDVECYQIATGNHTVGKHSEKEKVVILLSFSFWSTMTTVSFCSFFLSFWIVWSRTRVETIGSDVWVHNAWLFSHEKKSNERKKKKRKEKNLYFQLWNFDHLSTSWGTWRHNNFFDSFSCSSNRKKRNVPCRVIRINRCTLAMIRSNLSMQCRRLLFFLKLNDLFDEKLIKSDVF